MWDKVLVDDIFSTNNPAVLAEHVMQGVKPSAFKTSGGHHTWAAKWATESMQLATRAYEDIKFVKAKVGAHGKLEKMDVTLTPSVDAYRSKFKDRAADQLRKAGLRLAHLLDSIEWEGIE